jgi:Flp pilus assembly protein CpaB
MSDRRYTAIFGAALLTAGAATFSVYRILSDAATPRQEPTQPVVVLSEDVPAGLPVPREALTRVLWPTRVAPPGAFASVDSVAGRVARVALAGGQPVRASALAPRGAAPGLEGTIDATHRAIAVRVSEAAGMSGLLRPDSRVDVLVTSRGDGSGAPPDARLVMADVRVLGVGPARPANAKPGDPATADGSPLPPNLASIVTLEVTPAQAAQIAAAELQGAVQVVLRGFGSAPGGAAGDAPIVAAAPGGRAWPPAGSMAVSEGLEGLEGLEGRAPARPRRPAAPAVDPAAGARPAPAPVAQAPAPAAPAAASPDSVVVRVYRSGQLSVVRVEPGAAAAAPPAPLQAAVGRP